MLTEFGKTARKYRIDKGLSLKYVADGIPVTSAFLSAVEMGRKPLTVELVSKVAKVMALDQAESDNLFSSAAKSMNEVKIKSSDDEEVEVALMFARKLTDGNINLARFKKYLEGLDGF